jgi:hypothetical protein
MGLNTEDRLAIQELYARYNHAIDFGHADDWAACFTPEGTFSSPGAPESKGTAALAAFASGFAATMKARHWTNNLVLTPNGNGVSGTCYLVLLNLAAKPASIMISGIYQDELVRSGGEWKFASRKVSVD